jgi:glycosyltransferase involved in cell wall biosynthesis
MNEIKPKISVIIPCYNHGKYLNDAVSSVLNQTYQNFEILIINDGSTDKETVNILRDFKRPKTRIVNIPNQGPSQARNIGISEAKAEYIFNLDADDKIDRTYFEKGIRILDSDPDIGLVFADYKYFGKWSFIEKVNYKFPEYLLLGNCAILPNAFFRKSDWQKVGGFKTNMKKGLEDYDFWVSIAGLGVKVHHIPEVLIHYRSYPDNSSRSGVLMLNQIKDCYHTIYENNKGVYLNNINVLLDRIVDSEYNERDYRKLIKYLITFIFITYVLIVSLVLFPAFTIYSGICYSLLSILLAIKFNLNR